MIDRLQQELMIKDQEMILNKHYNQNTLTARLRSFWRDTESETKSMLPEYGPAIQELSWSVIRPRTLPNVLSMPAPSRPKPSANEQWF